MDKWQKEMLYEKIPELVLETLDLYVEKRIPTGSFLRAMLSNDLFGTMGRADNFNRLVLFEICTYIYNELPAACYGSREAVDNWLKNKTFYGDE